MYFECKDAHLNKQVAHILLIMGDEGVRMYNSWGLPAEESTIPVVIWEKSIPRSNTSLVLGSNG